MLLSIKNLSVKVQIQSMDRLLVNDISLDIDKQKIVSLVGGSGSGKTTTGLSILKLLSPELKIYQGEILYKNENLLRYSEKRMRQVRGCEISMIFQEPLNAFNPVFNIGSQIDEMLKFNTKMSAAQRKNRIEELLTIVGLPDPVRVCRQYPHQLSGGMRQRAMIAQAIAAEPKLIIADEPTSNIDVTLQAKILELFKKLKDEMQLSILLITHDLGLVKHLSDEVAVMTEGKIIEQGDTAQVLSNPKHKYTCRLMDTIKV